MKQLLLSTAWVIFLVLNIQVLMAQSPSDNSPYSRYGLGNLVSTDFGAINGMGGISTAYHTSNSINLSNPASLGYLRTTAFEVGLYSDFSWLSTNDASTLSVDGNLTHLVLGFPLKNPINQITNIKRSPYNWGMAMGIVPYSRVGYEIETEDIVPNIDTVLYRYNGSGGLYQLFLANGVSYNNFSVGFTAGYLFGNISQNRTAIFTDVANSSWSILNDDINHSGFVYNIGLQQELELKDDLKLLLGATANNTMTVGTETRTLNRRYNSLSGYDTITNSLSTGETATLPLEYSFGATLKKDNKWLIGLQYSAARWSEYENSAKPDQLADTYKVAFGAEIVPDHNAINRYGKRISYRLGAFYQTDPRLVGSDQLQSYAVTAGVGLPIILPKKGLVGHTNLSFELGKIGYNTAISENYLKIKAAFTFNDSGWFYKRQFN